MQIDFFTKSVLTVIAVALSVIALRGAVPSAKAQIEGPTHVIVDSVASYAFMYAGPIEVRVQQ